MIMDRSMKRDSNTSICRCIVRLHSTALGKTKGYSSEVEGCFHANLPSAVQTAFHVIFPSMVVMDGFSLVAFALFE